MEQSENFTGMYKCPSWLWSSVSAEVKQSFSASKDLLGRASVLQITVSKTSHQRKESVFAEGKNSPNFLLQVNFRIKEELMNIFW